MPESRVGRNACRTSIVRLTANPNAMVNNTALLVCSHRGKIRVEEKAERDKARDVDSYILPVIPVGAEFVPGSFKKLFMQYKEPFGNVKIGRRIYLVMDNASISFIEKIEPDSTLTRREICLLARLPAFVMLRDLVGCQFAVVNRKPFQLPGPVIRCRWSVADYELTRQLRT